MKTKRLHLKQFRVGLDLTQEQMASRLNVAIQTYVAIENGLRNGNHLFWQRFQTEFKVADSEMWQLQKKTEGNIMNA